MSDRYSREAKALVHDMHAIAEGARGYAIRAFRRIATEAERRGAERMREAAAARADLAGEDLLARTIADDIRALPLDADEVKHDKRRT